MGARGPAPARTPSRSDMALRPAAPGAARPPLPAALALAGLLLALVTGAEVAEAHGLAVAYKRVLPWPKSFTVTEWESKKDLIDTICASCNW